MLYLKVCRITLFFFKICFDHVMVSIIFLTWWISLSFILAHKHSALVCFTIDDKGVFLFVCFFYTWCTVQSDFWRRKKNICFTFDFPFQNYLVIAHFFCMTLLCTFHSSKQNVLTHLGIWTIHFQEAVV